MIPLLQELSVLDPLLINFGASFTELLSLDFFICIMDLIRSTSWDNFEKYVAQNRHCECLSFFWLIGMKSEGLRLGACGLDGDQVMRVRVSGRERRVGMLYRREV